jgi:multidrug efflux pump subunit AcrA (membrane-fusion protein)
MIESGRLVRVEVTVPGIVTAQGVQVGDAEVHTQRIYGRRLKVEPSAYSGDEGGRYLTVRSRDGRYGLRFVTEKGKIVTLYGGTYTAIQYVEGCE